MTGMIRGALCLALAMLVSACTQNAAYRFTEYAWGVEQDKDNKCVPPKPYFANNDPKSGLVTGFDYSGIVDRCKHVFPEKLRFDEPSDGDSKKNVMLFPIEFDDQGRFHDIRQFLALKTYLKERDAVSIVVFVHGWRHNASYDDDNVDLARKILAGTAAVENTNSAAAREVVGVYIGWRGLSTTLRPLPSNVYELASFWDRKATAERVAAGQVREVFAYLSRYKEETNLKGKSKVPNVRLLILGHSFGGLIVYHSVAESLVREVANSDPGDRCRGPERGIADMVVVINSAFEAARYHPVHDAQVRAFESKPLAKSCGDAPVPPLFVSVTAESDNATGIAFPLGRAVSTVWEDVSPTLSRDADPNDPAIKKVAERLEAQRKEERGALITAIGHFDSFRMFTLNAKSRKDAGCDDKTKGQCACFNPAGNWEKNNEDQSMFYANAGAGMPRRYLCLYDRDNPGTLLELTDDKGFDRTRPMWVVRSTDDRILEGHSGRLDGEPIRQFIVQLYHDMVSSRKSLEKTPAAAAPGR